MLFILLELENAISSVIFYLRSRQSRKISGRNLLRLPLHRIASRKSLVVPCIYYLLVFAFSEQNHIKILRTSLYNINIFSFFMLIRTTVRQVILVKLFV
jgi:hypothetical protein